MTQSNFMDTFMEEFEDTLKKSAEESLTKYVETYESQLTHIEKSNDKLMNKSIDEYHKKREELATEIDKMINKKLANSKRSFESKLQDIDDELFKDPNGLYQKIVASADALKKKQKSFNDEKRKWNKDDQRIAEYLGISFENEEKKSTQDDEKEADAALQKNAELISDSDPIMIKIDDKIFRTTRGTLTQVNGSFIAKLFGAHHDMMWRDEEGAYYLNCNPNTFAQVLDILRAKGKVTNEFKMTHTLYAALLQFGILNKFFPSFDASALSVSVRDESKSDYHVVFKAYRSNAFKSTYLPRWNKEILSSDERKEDDEKYWKVSAADDSIIEFVETGYYRVTFRSCMYYAAHGYVQLRINGSLVSYAHNYGYGSSNYKSYNFNEIMQINATQKLSFYVYPAPYTEEKSSYLCIEKIPGAMLPFIAIWKSSATNAYYRQWNNAIKTCDRYTLSNSNKNVNIQKGGLYRISSRVHSNYGSGGQQYMYLHEFRNGGKHNHISAKATGTTNYQSHMFDEICSLKQADYLTMYDASYGTIGNAQYDCFQIEYLPFTDVFGVWKSASVVSTYQRAWDHTYWCADMLYSLNNTKNVIEVKQDGNYRISSHVTQSTSSSQAGHSALYINNSQYCLARYGAHGSTYQHTTTIQEILKLKKGDKMYIYSSHPYNSRDYNSLYIEKLY